MQVLVRMFLSYQLHKVWLSERSTYRPVCTKQHDTPSSKCGGHKSKYIHFIKCCHVWVICGYTSSPSQGNSRRFDNNLQFKKEELICKAHFLYFNRHSKILTIAGNYLQLFIFLWWLLPLTWLFVTRTCIAFLISARVTTNGAWC